MSDSHQRRLGAGLLAGFLYLAYCVMRQAVWLQQLDTTVSHLMSPCCHTVKHNRIKRHCLSWQPSRCHRTDLHLVRLALGQKQRYH